MHPEARDFTLFVKQYLTNYFSDKKVLDVGSGDINGNNRFLFTNCEYEGNDVFQARNVTIVSPTSTLPFAPNTFDTIVSTECFEHDPEFAASIRKIVDMLKPGGLFAFTCASTGRGEHGTRRTTPENSFGAIGGVEVWMDHYKNITYDDLKEAIPITDVFSQYAVYFNSSMCDLYFWGIKRGNSVTPVHVPTYSGRGIHLIHAYSNV